MGTNKHRFITVKVPHTEKPGVEIKTTLYSNVFAQSAFDNDVTFEEFKMSMDSFSQESVSSVPQIQAWRDEATEIFFELLEAAGKLKLTPVEFIGGSDFDDDETALVDDNKNNIIERKNRNGEFES